MLRGLLFVLHLVRSEIAFYGRSALAQEALKRVRNEAQSALGVHDYQQIPWAFG